ncbi:MAG TPA: hypothetical protein PK239_15875 [Chitinophagales bacterium]|nr:hypothetical protein [Chitinophagales bacterium]HRK28753.1 hypothetical protein [Chitinophagales bacterium]
MSKVEYAIVVKNKTRLELLIERFNTKAQARFYIERSGGNYDDYETEHEVFHASLNRLLAVLGKTLKYKVVERIYVPSFLFAPNQVIVVIGQDGLVANTAKYANGVPIVAVNPDKKRYDGILLPFDVHNFVDAVEKVLTQTHRLKQVTFAEARLQDGQRLLAFNDLFIGAATHVSARYRITYNRQTEEHSSSGLIVSTKAGFTGWLSSVFNMAKGIGQFLGHEPYQSNTRHEAIPLQTPTLTDEQLLFAVREPFKSIKTQTGIVAGIISHELDLTIESLMPANGVIFSDGIEADFLKFNSGAIAKIGIAPEKAALVLP